MILKFRHLIFLSEYIVLSDSCLDLTTVVATRINSYVMDRFLEHDYAKY